ncbi:MAG: hypothetical protein AAF639_41185, partial [Chloroflexota bacterium]
MLTTLSQDGYVTANTYTALKTAKDNSAWVRTIPDPAQRHQDTITSIAFSPDGKYIVSASADKTIRLWEIPEFKVAWVAFGHTDAVNAVAFSADGQYIVSASDDRTVGIWAVDSGKQQKILSGHTDAVNDVAFSPDGQQVVSASDDTTVRVWNWRVDTVKEPRVLDMHIGAVQTVAFSPDGSRIISGDKNQTLLVWDATSGEQINPKSNLLSNINSVAFSNNGTIFAIGGNDFMVRIWQTDQMSNLHQYEHSAAITSIAFSQDDKYIISGDEASTVIIWDRITESTVAEFHEPAPISSVAFGSAGSPPDTDSDTEYIAVSSDRTIHLLDRATRETITQLEGNTEPVYSLSMSSDGAYLASGGDSSVQIWDAYTGQRIKRVNGHTSEVWAVDFNPSLEYQHVASAGADNIVRIWDIGTQNHQPQQIQEMKEHAESIWAIAYSPDGKRLVSGGSDLIIRVWDAITGKLTLQIDNYNEEGHTKIIQSLQFSPDGNYILSAGQDGAIIAWDVSTGKQHQAISNDQRSLNSVAYDFDGKRILSAGDDAMIKIWTLDGQTEPTTLIGHPYKVFSAEFSPDPDGQYIVSGGETDTSIHLWNANTGELLLRLDGHGQKIWDIEFSPDGKRVISGGEDGIRIWNVSQLLSTENHSAGMHFNQYTDVVQQIRFSPDGQRIASAGHDNTIRIWDTYMGQELVRFVGHTSPVNTIAFSPDGHYLVSGSGYKDKPEDIDLSPSNHDNTVRLWDTHTGQQISQFTNHTDSVNAVVFSPDGKHVVSGSSDHTVRIWNTEQEEQIAQFGEHEGVVNAVSFSPEEMKIVSASDDKTVRIWDIHKNRQIRAFTKHTAPVNSATFSPDGTQIVSVSKDKTMRIWDSTTGDEESQLQIQGVHTASFSPDGQYIVYEGADHFLRIWDIDSQQHVVDIHGHADAILSTAFSPNGKLIASSSADKTIRIWETPEYLLHWAVAHISRPIPLLSDRERQQFGIKNEISIPTYKELQPFMQEAQALRLRETGMALAYTGQITSAVTYLEQAEILNLRDLSANQPISVPVINPIPIGIDNDIPISPQTLTERVLRNRVQHLLSAGFNFAKQGEREAAQNQFEKAVAIDNTLQLHELGDQADLIRADALRQEAYTLIQSANFNDAIPKLAKATSLNDSTQTLVADALVSAGRLFIIKEEYFNAITAYQELISYEEMHEYNYEKITVNELFYLCLEGIEEKQAEIIHICEKAHNLDENNDLIFSVLEQVRIWIEGGSINVTESVKRILRIADEMDVEIEQEWGDYFDDDYAD